jgi:hypothetical protein
LLLGSHPQTQNKNLTCPHATDKSPLEEMMDAWENGVFLLDLFKESVDESLDVFNEMVTYVANKSKAPVAKVVAALLDRRTNMRRKQELRLLVLDP